MTWCNVILIGPKHFTEDDQCFLEGQHLGGGGRGLSPPLCKSSCRRPWGCTLKCSSKSWAGFLPDLRITGSKGLAQNFWGPSSALNTGKKTETPREGPLFFCTKFGLGETLVIVPSGQNGKWWTKVVAPLGTAPLKCSSKRALHRVPLMGWQVLRNGVNFCCPMQLNTAALR